MKKVWSILLCAVMLMGVSLSAGAAAQNALAAPVAVEAHRSADSSTVTVDIVLTEPVTDGSFTFTYDTRHLRLTAVSAPAPSAAEINGPAGTSGVSAGANLAAGTVRTAFVFDESGRTGDVLLRCTFQVLGGTLTTTVNVTGADLKNDSAALSCPEIAAPLLLQDLGVEVAPVEKPGTDAPADTPAAPSKSFTDVHPGDWFYDEVTNMAELGYIQGVSATAFEPDSGLTRAMLVTILYRIDGERAVTSTAAFTDVVKGSWYEKAVNWAAANGIVTGYSESTFAPEDPITRQQMATVLWRYAKYAGLDVTSNGTTLPDFTDRNEIESWAGEAISWAYSRGIMKGTGANTLSPEGGATRAEAAVMLYRLLHLLPNYQ